MRILWICGLPRALEEEVLGGQPHGAYSEWSWILSHLPPPPEVELHIACHWPGGHSPKSFEARGATWHLVPCPARGRSLRLFYGDERRFFWVRDLLTPDVIHGWGTEDSHALVAEKLAPKTHVVGIQGLMGECRARGKMSFRSRITQLTERIALAKARQVVTESNYAKNAVRPYCSSAQISIVEHPLRPAFLSPRQRPRAGCSNGVFLGIIDERKGIFDAIRAFAGAMDPPSTLTIIGSGSRANEARMQALVRELDLNDRIAHHRRLGPEDILGVMARASIFLLPTRVDTGPTALKEALSQGLWPVCYDNTGPGEYIRNFKFGSLAIDGDIRDLTQILRLAAQKRPWDDPKLLARVQGEARALFSPECAWAKLLDVYRRTCILNP